MYFQVPGRGSFFQNNRHQGAVPGVILRLRRFFLSTPHDSPRNDGWDAVVCQPVGWQERRSLLSKGAMVAHQATVDADFWHVALGPGETKVLTLEQLDDLFRLDIIDA